MILSCSGKITSDNYSRIANGMTKSEVQEILGPGESAAESTYMDYSSEVVTWKSGMKVISISFSNGEVIAKAQSGL